ncbi:hypothetical protein TSUD_162760 [Trifolium subterraneum]|uniref:Uncharacterized protein n=1 Tax=Trifolium subterraneum TaxID=3900 RepID=A0A2Z6MPB7_TRISU|nr:hypothetical protein TSUD_162760 [Trifolium subterraneum]
MPNVFGTVVHLLQKLNITNIEAIVEQTLLVVDILKLALVSKTPLTDFIFKKNNLCDEFDDRNQYEYKNGEEISGEGRQMSVKVLRRKSTGEILFVEGGGLTILKASLTSTSTFTNGLNQFITSYATIKEEI